MYETILENSMGLPLNLTSQSVYVQQCYDATWTLAKALDLTLRGNDAMEIVNPRARHICSGGVIIVVCLCICVSVCLSVCTCLLPH